MEIKLIREFLTEKRGYLKKSNEYILDRLDIEVDEYTLELVSRIKKEIKIELGSVTKKTPVNYGKLSAGLNSNILIIGDLHEPFLFTRILGVL